MARTTGTWNVWPGSSACGSDGCAPNTISNGRNALPLTVMVRQGSGMARFFVGKALARPACGESSG